MRRLLLVSTIALVGCGQASGDDGERGNSGIDAAADSRADSATVTEAGDDTGVVVDSGTASDSAAADTGGFTCPSTEFGGPIADPSVTLTAYATTAGQAIKLPRSGYEIAPGLQSRVLFLDDDSMTVKYTGEDNVVSGYTIHVLDLCIDPKRAKEYVDAVGKGRSSLPALAAGQLFAKARGTSVRIAIRDTGSFMDPRVKKDWYQS